MAKSRTLTAWGGNIKGQLKGLQVRYIEFMREYAEFKKWEAKTARAIHSESTHSVTSLKQPGYLLDRAYIPENSISIMEVADRWGLSFSQCKYYATLPDFPLVVGWHNWLPSLNDPDKIDCREDGSPAVSFRLFVSMDTIYKIEEVRPQLKAAARNYLDRVNLLNELYKLNDVGLEKAKEVKKLRVFWFSAPFLIGRAISRFFYRSSSDELKADFISAMTDRRCSSVSFEQLKDEYIRIFGKRSYTDEIATKIDSGSFYSSSRNFPEHAENKTSPDSERWQSSVEAACSALVEAITSGNKWKKKDFLELLIQKYNGSGLPLIQAEETAWRQLPQQYKKGPGRPSGEEKENHKNPQEGIAQ